MIKLLIGGSPCTFWSISKHGGREVEPSGQGWELFKNYLIAKEKFNPDYFLYENNQSASESIKQQICKELGCDLMYINSALVSGQNRKRFYVFNWEVEQPEDKRIYLKDVIDDYVNDDISGKDKLVRVGSINGKDSMADRIYSIEGKSVTLTANGGGLGAKTGLYAVPYNSMVTISYNKDSALNKLYHVENGKIHIKDKVYDIKLKDGDYIIRKLHPEECERLQTLPVGYTSGISTTQRLKALGNGWTADVIIHILEGILKNVPKDEKIVVLSMYDGIATGRYCLDKMGFTNIEYYAFEINKYAISVAKKNYPDIIELGDAFQIREKSIEKSIDKIIYE